MEVRTLGAGDEEVLRAIRLAALTTDPVAFGSTLSREQAFGRRDWTSRLGPPAVTFVVAPDPSADPVGMAWGVPAAGDDGLVHLSGMWVAPSARGSGAADALVEAVLAWADGRGAVRVGLTVVEGNEPAERLYRRHGFVATGEVERRVRDGRVEREMERRR